MVGHASCRACMNFENSPGAVEAALPGLTSFSSAYAAVRSDDGVCAALDRYVAASSLCGEFRPRSQPRRCGS